MQRIQAESVHTRRTMDFTKSRSELAGMSGLRAKSLKAGKLKQLACRIT
jgi:hypothetical protein